MHRTSSKSALLLRGSGAASARAIDKDARLIDAFLRLASTHEKEEALNATIEEVGKLLDAEGTSLWLVSKDNPNRIVCAATHAKDGRVRVSESFYTNEKINGFHDGLTGWVFAKGKPLRIKNITDTNEISRIAPDLKWSDKFGGWQSSKPHDKVRPFLAVPLSSARDPRKVIGVLRVATTRNRRPFESDDEKLLITFGRQLSFVISNFQRREDEEELLSILFKLGDTVDLDTLLNRAVSGFQARFPGSHCSILLDDGTGKFHIRATSAEHLRNRIREGTLSPYDKGEGKTGKVIQTGESALNVAEMGQTLGSSKPPDDCETLEPATSFIASPLTKEGGVRGVIRSGRSDPNPVFHFTPADRDLLDSYARQVSYLINIMEAHTIPVHQQIREKIGRFLPIPDPDKLVAEFSEPQYRNVTIMFLDLKGFTNFCKQHLGSASQIATMLTLFFETVGPSVSKYSGTIDKFQGDGFIALFNAYTDCNLHEQQAVSCARDIKKAFESDFKKNLQDVLKESYGIVLKEINITLGLKIGIGTGKVIVGPLGFGVSGCKRSEFTIIGEEVSIVSRLVSDVVVDVQSPAAAARGSSIILCTFNTFEKIKTPSQARKHEVNIRGPNACRVIYEIE